MLGPDAVLCATALSPSLAGAEEAECSRPGLGVGTALGGGGDSDGKQVPPTWSKRRIGAPAARRRSWTCSARWRPPSRPRWRLGVNVSDLGDHRPGQAAAAAAAPCSPWWRPVHQGRHPSLVASARPADLGQAGRGLLASRLPYGTPVTLARLGAVESAEGVAAGAGLRTAAGPSPRCGGPGGGRAPALAEVVARRTEVVAVVRAAGGSASWPWTSRASARAASTGNWNDNAEERS